jgi:flagellar hook-basal body complex protein FliE
MSVSISALGPPAAIPVTPLDSGTPTAVGFGSILQDAMQKVGQLDNQATASVQSFLSGEGDDLQTTIMATQRADLAGELFLQVRNKVVAAYQEVMKLQV